MSIKRPQSPMKLNGDYFYPMTTASQVVMDEENGKRLNTLLKENIIYYNDEEATDVEIGLVDADLLGGKSAEDYVLKEEIGDLEGGGGDITVNLGGAETSGQASTVNADLLGSIPASEYVKKSELDTSNMDLLWENPDPTAAFGGQNVSVNLSSYSFYYIEYLYGTGSSQRVNYAFSRVGKGTALMVNSGVDGGIRDVDYNSTYLAFSDSTYNNSTNNATCIPQRIYGIKDTFIVSSGTSAIDNAGLVNLIYPVGSIYMSMNEVSPATLFGVGTWEQIAQGRTLFGADGSTYKAGNTVEAGLPNITGYFTAKAGGTADGVLFTHSGYGQDEMTSSGTGSRWTFDASKYNSIYGKSTTVQPPAFVVYMWQRIS